MVSNMKALKYLVPPVVLSLLMCLCPAASAEVVKLENSQALLLVSADSNSTDSDAASVSLIEAGLVDPNALAIDANTVLSFYEVGELDNPGPHGDCLVPPCFDNVSLVVTDNRGNVLVYVLQRPADAVAKTPDANSPGTYAEIFLDPTGIYYQRNLFADFRTLPAFDPAGAEISSIEFRVDEHGSAMIDKVALGPGTAGKIVPVYRFWAPELGSHFYTTSAAEKQAMMNEYSYVWAFEGIACFALADGSDPNAVPVYRLWSPVYSSHFYTTNKTEKDWLLCVYPTIWKYEEIAFYAYPEGRQPAESRPMYRFWSGVLNAHFYTVSKSERDNLLRNYSGVWMPEGVAWYAFPPQWDWAQAVETLRDHEISSAGK